ncbi:MAG TPA: carbamate kinase [Gemmatimonadota bacterium]
MISPGARPGAPGTNRHATAAGDTPGSPAAAEPRPHPHGEPGERRRVARPMAVVALGGNAFREDGDASLAAQRRVVTAAAARLPAVLRAGYRLLVTHGNGPQVGAELQKNECAPPEHLPLPLELCVAETQGSLGYLLESALARVLAREPRCAGVAALVTRVRVTGDDPSFASPTKFVGPFYSETQIHQLARERGWKVAPAGERGWRRVVPSPEPVEVLNAPALRALLTNRFAVVAGGGGGVPVVEREGSLEGVDAVVDKDLTAALIARAIGAELLVILSDVDAVYLDHGRPSRRRLGRVPADEMRRHQAEGHFPAGSMGPKVEAALRFAEATGHTARIGDIRSLEAVLRGEAGTAVVP